MPCKVLIDKNRKISKRQLSILRGKNDELESGSINLFGGRKVSTEAHVPTPNLFPRGRDPFGQLRGFFQRMTKGTPGDEVDQLRGMARNTVRMREEVA